MRTLSQVAAVGGFDPIADVAWTHAYWAEGAKLMATSPTNNVSISTWPDEVGSGDITVVPTFNGGRYIAAATELGGRPAIRFLAAAPCRMQGSWSVVSQPNTLVVVGAHADGSGSRDLVDSDATNRQLLDDSSGVWRMFAGTSASTGAPSSDTGKHIFIAYYNGAGSTLSIDGSTVSVGNPGSNGVSAPQLGFSVSTSRNVAYALVGWKSGALTADERDGLIAWSQSRYATP